MAIPQVPSQLMNILASKTYNAAWFSGTTVEEQIQNAINTAAADGATIVFIPASMFPFNESLLTQSVNVTLMYEGEGVESLNAAAFPGATIEDRIEAAMDAAILMGVPVVEIPNSFIPFSAGLITQAKFGQVKLTRVGGSQSVFDISAYGAPLTGVTSGSAPDMLQALQRATYAAQHFGGGVIDMRHQANALYISGDFCNNLFAYERAPITFLWGPAEYRMVTTWRPRSHHHHIFHNTVWKAADAAGTRVAIVMVELMTVSVGGPGNGISMTNGSAVMTKKSPSQANWQYLEVGSPVAYFGKKPYLGKDINQLNGALTDTATTITVDSTAGFPTTYPTYIRIDDEIIFYTAHNGTQFTGCIRGVQGSTAVSHLDNAPVERVSYEAFVCKSISGNDFTLDNAIDPRAAADATLNTGTGIAEGVTCVIGSLDVRFDGQGVIDGGWRETGAGEAANAQGIYSLRARHVYIGPGIRMSGWEFACVTLDSGQDCEIYCSVDNVGNFFEQVGEAFWVFGGAKRNKVHIARAHTVTGVFGCDDRSTIARDVDMPCWGNTCVCDEIDDFGVAGGVTFLIGGGHDNSMTVKVAKNARASAHLAQFQTNQWISQPVVGEGNYFELHSFQGDATAFAFEATTSYANTKNSVNIQARGCKIGSQSGIGFTGRIGQFPLTDAATIAVDASFGDHAEVTLGGNRTMGTPTNPVDGQTLTFSILQDGTGGRTLTWPTGTDNFVLTWSNTGNVANARSFIKVRYSQARRRWEQVAAQSPYV